MLDPSSSRDRGLKWEQMEGSVTEANRKRGKCQFMVPSAKDDRARWIPRGRPRRAVRPQLERELGLGGAGSQRTERSGDEEGHSRKEAAVAPADGLE